MYLLVDPPVRLVGGSGSHEGRVEILLHGEWGTVCDDEWTLNDARVVCRQLGWSDQWPLPLTNAQFGQGTGTIWLDAVQCTGSEAHLYDCPNLGVGIHDCEHTEDAGVRCDCGNECVYGRFHQHASAFVSPVRNYLSKYLAVKTFVDQIISDW